MGNTVREFSSLGIQDNENQSRGGIEDSETSEQLGDRIAGTFDDLNVDSVKAVRKLREDE